MPKQAARALNATAKRSHTRVRRELAQETGVQQKLLRKRVQWFPATERKLASNVWIGVKAPIYFRELGAKLNRAGIFKKGKIKISSAFEAKMPNGKTGVFVRKPDAEHKTRPDGQRTQLPIVAPSIELGPPGKPIIERVTRDMMRTYYPAELRRLAEVAARRAARKS